VADKQLCQTHGSALISTVSLIEAPLLAPKPVVISLLEGGEDPWIPDVHSSENVAGDLSPGEEEVGAGKSHPWLGKILGTMCYFWISSIQQQMRSQI